MSGVTGPLLVAAGVATAVTLVSVFLPASAVGTAVAMIFFAATWATVWRLDDDTAERYGLAVGGLALRRSINWTRLGRDGLHGLLWALGAALVTFVPFYVGWRVWWAPTQQFTWSWPGLLNDATGQLLVVALPEEAFFRGYLQTRFDEELAPRVRLLGARVGWGLVLTSAIFALGHVLTVHRGTRLAVFFPSLLFGWLRARTGGIGASVAFHALCNLFSEALGRGFGAY